MVNSWALSRRAIFNRRKEQQRAQVSCKLPSQTEGKILLRNLAFQMDPSWGSLSFKRATPVQHYKHIPEICLDREVVAPTRTLLCALRTAVCSLPPVRIGTGNCKGCETHNSQRKGRKKGAVEFFAHGNFVDHLLSYIHCMIWKDSSFYLDSHQDRNSNKTLLTSDTKVTLFPQPLLNFGLSREQLNPIGSHWAILGKGGVLQMFILVLAKILLEDKGGALIADYVYMLSLWEPEAEAERVM